MTLIRSSTALRNNYGEISELAKKTGEPIYITLNGNGDGVFMNMDAYDETVQKLKLRIMILEAEINDDGKRYSVDEVFNEIMDSIDNA